MPVSFLALVRILSDITVVLVSVVTISFLDSKQYFLFGIAQFFYASLKEIIPPQGVMFHSPFPQEQIRAGNIGHGSFSKTGQVLIEIVHHAGSAAIVFHAVK